ncbi:MAG TPA: alpha/beta hydrolase [Sulfurovum sp.]|nr:alpha/beta hydrolase [Sulfurovum sp.]
MRENINERCMKFYRMLLKKPLREFQRVSSDVFVGENKIKCAHISKGVPTIVFENGFCSGMSCMKYWDSAFMELSKEFSLFAYDRVDDALSKKNIEDMRTHLEDKTEALRIMLEKKGLKAPYILVGHSLGGLYVQHFAKKYPNEVEGMVLVDAVYPEILTEESVKGSEENIVLDTNIAKMGEVILAMPDFDTKLMFILSATQEEHKKDNPDKVTMINRAIEKQKNYIKLYPFAQQTWIDCGHLIQYEKPESIVITVREMVKVLKK